MVAAPYKITLVCALGSPNGPKKLYSLTASDVNAAFWLFPAGTSSNVLNGTQDVYIVDAILSAAGTDTTQSEVYIGGVSTGFKLLNATSLATTIVRPFPSSPLRVPAGLPVQFTQLT